jgi:hypothetical protein
MDLETLWYEISPYIYFIIGAGSIFFGPTYFAKLPGGLLIIAALTIIRLRWLHRRLEDEKIKRL